MLSLEKKIEHHSPGTNSFLRFEVRATKLKVQVQEWLCWWSCHCVARESTNYSTWLSGKQSALTGCLLSNQKQHLPTSQTGDIVRSTETLSEEGRMSSGGGKMPFMRPPWATSWYLSVKHSQEEEKREKQPLSVYSIALQDHQQSASCLTHTLYQIFSSTIPKVLLFQEKWEKKD